MKKLLAMLMACMIAMPVLAKEEPAKPETKKVCVKQKDAKTGKEKDVCKNIKIHKKHEGTAVPDKAGKK